MIRQARAAGSIEAVRAFGDEVRRRRIALNITQKMLAEKAGLSPTYLSNIERGRRPRGLSLDAAFRIAKGMGIDVPDLVGGYMALSGEGIEVARLILSIPPKSRRPLLELVRSLASAGR